MRLACPENSRPHAVHPEGTQSWLLEVDPASTTPIQNTSAGAETVVDADAPCSPFVFERVSARDSSASSDTVGAEPVRSSVVHLVASFRYFLKHWELRFD